MVDKAVQNLVERSWKNIFEPATKIFVDTVALPSLVCFPQPIALTILLLSI